MPLLLVTIVLLRGEKFLLGRRGYAMIGGRTGAPQLTRLGLWRWPALLAALFVLFVTVLLPNLVLIRASMLRTVSDPVEPQHHHLVECAAGIQPEPHRGHAVEHAWSPE